MNIGLIDIDSKNFPNLCLMKISAYHKFRGDNVEWWNGLKHYDIVYKSKVFTEEYSQDENTYINADKIIEGGTGYDLKNKLPPKIEHIMPDYSLYDNPKFQDTAYGFLTRGCPRGCSFCIVSKKEGTKSKHVSDLLEFWTNQKIIKLLDPNILACKDNEKLLTQLINCGAYVDFTQGLDARLINKDNVKLLHKIKTKMIHFAFDQLKNESSIMKGLELYAEKLDKSRMGRASVYILTNFDTTLAQDFYRIKKVISLGYLPDIRIFNKEKLKSETLYQPEKQVILWLQRWANNKFIFNSCDFLDYIPKKQINIRQYLNKYNIKII